MEKYYITRYYLSPAVFVHLGYKIRKYCQPSFGYSWHKHTRTHTENKPNQKKNPKLQACFIFQLVKDHGNLSLAAYGDAMLLVRLFFAPSAAAGEGRLSAAGTQNFTTSRPSVQTHLWERLSLNFRLGIARYILSFLCSPDLFVRNKAGGGTQNHKSSSYLEAVLLILTRRRWETAWRFCTNNFPGRVSCRYVLAKQTQMWTDDKLHMHNSGTDKTSHEPRAAIWEAFTFSIFKAFIDTCPHRPRTLAGQQLHKPQFCSRSPSCRCSALLERGPSVPFRLRVRTQKPLSTVRRSPGDTACGKAPPGWPAAFQELGQGSKGRCTTGEHGKGGEVSWWRENELSPAGFSLEATTVRFLNESRKKG